MIETHLKLSCCFLGNSIGRQIQQELIPKLCQLRDLYPLSFATMFTLSFLLKLGLPPHIQCGDIEQSDKFFNSLQKN